MCHMSVCLFFFFFFQYLFGCAGGSGPTAHEIYCLSCSILNLELWLVGFSSPDQGLNLSPALEVEITSSCLRKSLHLLNHRSHQQVPETHGVTVLFFHMVCICHSANCSPLFWTRLLSAEVVAGTRIAQRLGSLELGFHTFVLSPYWWYRWVKLISAESTSLSSQDNISIDRK